MLGYNIFDPTEFAPEQSATVGSEKWGNIDYSVHVNGSRAFIVEAKSVGVSLNSGHVTQLYHYFTTAGVKFAILTNGVEYRFFTDREKANLMDSEPFMTLDVLHPERANFDLLHLFCKSEFDGARIASVLEAMCVKAAMRAALDKLLDGPSDELVRLLIARFSKDKGRAALDRYRAHALAVVRDYLRENTPERPGEVPAEIPADTSTEGEAVPMSPEVLRDIVKVVLADASLTGTPVVYHLQSGYVVYYRDSRLFRVTFNHARQQAISIDFLQSLAGRSSKEGRRKVSDSVPIVSLSEIRQYADRIIAAAQDIDAYCEKQEAAR